MKRTVPIGTVRLVRKFKQRTNALYPYHYKKLYRTSVPYFLVKIEAYHTVLTYRTVPAILANLLLHVNHFFQRSITRFAYHYRTIRYSAITNEYRQNQEVVEIRF